MKTVCVLMALVSSAAAAEDLASDTAVRERLGARRVAIEAAHATAERECAQRFFVTDCLEAARTRRREALIEIDLSEATLDDAERSRRAGVRQKRIDEKRARQEADQRNRAAVPLLPPEAASAAVRPGVRLVPSLAPVPASPLPAADVRESPADAAQRRRDEPRARAAYEARQKEAIERREELQRRQQGKPKAAPLPPVVPASKP